MQPVLSTKSYRTHDRIAFALSPPRNRTAREPSREKPRKYRRRCRVVLSPQSGLSVNNREIRACLAYCGARSGRISLQLRLAGGESGIRTHVTLSSKHAFQACAFSHSAISPAKTGQNVLVGGCYSPCRVAENSPSGFDSFYGRKGDPRKSQAYRSGKELMLEDGIRSSRKSRPGQMNCRRMTLR